MNKPITNNSINRKQKPEIFNPESVSESDLNSAIDRDFGAATDHLTDGVSRRRWLQIMGASLALGGTVGCRYEEEKIAPFAFRPQNRTPGIPSRYATMLDFNGVTQPLMSTNYDGRPIKLDGNPSHPESMGASSAFMQAKILEFYDPDRLRAPLKKSAVESENPVFEETTWEEIAKAFGSLSGTNLSNVAILAQPSSSPSLMRMQEEFTKRGGSWFSFAPINDDNTRKGTKLAFGKPMRAQYKLDEAKIIVSLDADPLRLDHGSTGNCISFAKGRDADHKKMSRLYAIESQFSSTGSAADHRMSVPSAKIPGFVASLVDAVTNASPGTKVDKNLPYRKRVFAALVQDLVEHRGNGIILAGENQPPEVHALVHQLNETLGNNGKMIEFIEVPDPGQSSLELIQTFASQVNNGDFETVLVLGGNPVYDAPRSLKIGELLGKVKNSIYVACYKNETGRACKWISNMAHPLEVWKDGFAYDGSICVGQPLINPLFKGKSDIETLASLMGMETTDGQQIVRETLSLDDATWRKAVHDGFVEGSTSDSVEVTVSTDLTVGIEPDDSWSQPWDGNSLEVVFTPSNSVFDGRFANSSWLQELPDFFTKITWDNVAVVSPKTAAALGLQQSRDRNTLATLVIGGVEQKIPINIQPGQADGSIGVAIGYGRTAAGRVGGDVANGVDPIGHDVNDLRSIDKWLVCNNLTKDAAITSRTNYRLAMVQEPWEIDKTGRDEIQARMFRDANKKESDRSALIREGSFESYKKFLDHHPIDKTAEHQQPKTNPAVGKKGSLPVINNVSFVPDEKETGDDHDHGAHKPKWPEAFHMHHELFDLTPGARMDFTAENPAYTNMWGMAIDLNKCIGCNSCVVACQSENNIPVVGKADVWRGREMHWLRIDRYFGDNLYTEDARDDDKVIVHQPVTCQQCENAPCETVCPVAATVHSSEGLNDMVYNRCIGTRYCGNNCPYKVRRFNYFNYSDAVTLIKYPGADKLPAGDRQLQNLMMNPEVTVRSRGVMEKCTYCVQRIQNTKIKAKNEKRDIGPNEITTACQDACATNAITFGDLHNKESDVAKAHANPRAYVLLEELNNRPRTKYLARVSNPHPDLIDFDDRDSVGGLHGGGHHDEHDDHQEESPSQETTETTH